MTLAGTFTVAVAVAAGALWLGLDLLDVRGIKRERQIGSQVLFDLVKLAFAVVAGLGGLVALVVAYRKGSLLGGCPLGPGTAGRTHLDCNPM